MSFEAQIKNLELRLRMAVEHVAQCEQDLNTIRSKAGLPAAKSLFSFERPPGDGGWLSDPSRQEWLARKAARAPAARAAATWTEAYHASRERDHAAAEPSKIDPVATAAAIVKAAALARNEIVELPSPGSEARAILEAGAKRRSTDLEGKPL
jgi:hypothetical protein